MRRLVVVIASATLPFAVARCALLYDLGTNGYSVAGEGGDADSSSADCGADTCQASPFPLCDSNADCPDATCLQQTCLVGAMTMTLNACGLQPLCTP
jgi:hypothetical protein